LVGENFGIISNISANGGGSLTNVGGGGGGKLILDYSGKNFYSHDFSFPIPKNLSLEYGGY
jgi:hypothetical protein